jgi:hypothetical protein
MTLADRTAFRNQVYRSPRAHAALPAEVLRDYNTPLPCGIPAGCGQPVEDPCICHERPSPKGRPLVNGSFATMSYLL